MVRIQLETGYLDVEENTAFPLNFGVADIRDVSKRSGGFSKTITLSGTKNNHELLSHHYDVNIVDGTFNINTLTKCIVLQNGIPVMDNAFLQLISVTKVQNNDAHEQSITYECLVKDSQSSFFTAIDNKELTDLDFSYLNHVYNSTNVLATFDNTITEGFVYPLGMATGNVYPLKEFKPAIYAKLYFDQIFNSAGFQYEWATLSADNFDKLIIPYNGETSDADLESYKVTATATQTNSFSPAAGVQTGFSNTYGTWTEVLDVESVFDPTTGEYTAPFYVTSGEQITFSFEVDFDINLLNATGATAYLVDVDPAISGTKNYRYTAYIKPFVNGVDPYPASNGWSLGTVDQDEGDTLVNGSNNILSYVGNADVFVSNLSPGDVVTFKFGIRIQYNQPVVIGGVAPRWKDGPLTTDADVVISIELQSNLVTMNAIPSANIAGSGSTIQMNRYIPKKIKQKDFIKSIFMMYNLYTEIDPTEPNVLILKTRDDYYDSGTETDWTYKLAKDKEQQLAFLPELSAKKIQLSYKDDSDEPNIIYLNATKETYGQIEFEFDNEYVKGIDRKELIFSPTPVSVTSFNAFVPMIVGSSPKSNIRILLHNGRGTSQPFNIYDYGTTGISNNTSYPRIGHWDDPLNPTFDINFGICDYYYYDNYQATNNTLYNNYWRRTVSQINTGKMLTAYFNLNESDIQSLKLNHKIRIDNSWWNINRVIDYDCNSERFTKVELLSVDTEIDFAPFKTKRPNIGKKELISRASQWIKHQFTANNNVIAPGSDVMIKGIGNIVLEGVRGFLEGDNKTMSSSGLFSDEINGSPAGNIANSDLTFDDTHVHELDGYSMLLSNNAGLEEYISIGAGAVEIGYVSTPASENRVKVVNGKVDIDVAGSTFISSIAGTGVDIMQQLYLSNIPTYADDTAAGAGGLAQFGVYQTATGELRIKL